MNVATLVRTVRAGRARAAVSARAPGGQRAHTRRMAERAGEEEGGGGAVTVRRARREDMPRVHAMIHELAAYEGVPEGPQLTAHELESDGFDSEPAWFFALVAELGGEVVGYAVANRAYSSWTRRAYYLEDLYVREAARRRGVATALLAALCQLADDDHVTRIDWHVLESNAPARALYARLGARDLHLTEGRAALRLDLHNIRALARARLQPHTQ